MSLKVKLDLEYDIRQLKKVAETLPTELDEFHEDEDEDEDSSEA